MSHNPDKLLVLTAEYVDFAESSLKALAKEVLDPKAKVRNRGTVCIPAESAKDKKDHFPINDINQARNALSQVGKYTAVPAWYSGSLESLKKTISSKVHAKYPSIGKETAKKAAVESLISKYGQGLNSNYGGEGVAPSQMTAEQLAEKPAELGKLYKSLQISPQQYRDAIAIINKQEGGSATTPAWGPLSPYGTPDTITGHAPKSGPRSNFSQTIKDLQVKLRDTYKLTGADGKPLKDDGIMGPNTRFAIQSYKTEYNMPQATDAMAIYNIMNTTPEEHPGRYAATPGLPNNDIERKNPF